MTAGAPNPQLQHTRAAKILAGFKINDEKSDKFNTLSSAITAARQSDHVRKNNV